MGICNSQCYQQTQEEALDSIKTLNFKSGSELNGIQFTFTNRPLNELKGDCLVFYLDHTSELTSNQVMNKLGRNSRRKLFEYLTLAEQQIERNATKHSLMSISIPSIDYKYILFVKIQPWDGQSKEQITKKIYNLTVSYLEVFRLRKIKTFTIVQFDIRLGIHHSISCPTIARSIERYSDMIKNVTIVCNSNESINFYYRNFKSFRQNKHNASEDHQRTTIQIKKNSVKRKKSNLSDQMFY